MSFPTLKHCLVCEDIRLERGGKGSLLGFFGVAPDLRLPVKDFEEPVELAFAIVGRSGEGDEEGRLTFESEDGTSLIDREFAIPQPAGVPDFTRIVIEYSDTLPGPGDYSLNVYNEAGDLEFSATIPVTQAEQDEESVEEAGEAEG